MPQLKVSIDLKRQELEWILRKSQDCLTDLNHLEERFLAKIRAFNQHHCSFAYQEQLRVMIAEIAALHFDTHFEADIAENAFTDQQRAYCVLALGYFIEKTDFIDDCKPFFGYLDDYLLIALIHQQLHPLLEEYQAWKAQKNLVTPA